MKRVVLTAIITGIFNSVFDYLAFGQALIEVSMRNTLIVLFGSFVTGFTLAFFAGLVVKMLTKDK